MCRPVKYRLTTKEKRHVGIGRTAIDAGCEVPVRRRLGGGSAVRGRRRRPIMRGFGLGYRRRLIVVSCCHQRVDAGGYDRDNKGEADPRDAIEPGRRGGRRSVRVGR